MVDRTQSAIANAMLQGRGPDSVDRHNDDWRYYRMYPEMWDGIDEGTADGYNLQEESPRQHIFGTFAQYGGQPQNPDYPSARDRRTFDKTDDPTMRQRYEDSFGIQGRERQEQGDDYFPMPRSRPSEAPVASPQDYVGPLPDSLPPFETQGPLPEEAYGYMPGLKDRVMEQLTGGGPSRDLKSDRLDGDRFDRATAPFSDNPQGNIQDYRMMAIENMLKRSPGQLGPGDMDMQIQNDLNDLRQQHETDPDIQQWRRDHGF